MASLLLGHMLLGHMIQKASWYRMGTAKHLSTPLPGAGGRQGAAWTSELWGCSALPVEAKSRAASSELQLL